MPRTGLRSYQTSGPTATPTSLLQALQHKAKSYTASKEELNQDQIQELRSLSGEEPGWNTFVHIDNTVTGWQVSKQELLLRLQP
jgi:hypothetical protein